MERQAHGGASRATSGCSGGNSSVAMTLAPSWWTAQALLADRGMEIPT